MSKSSQTSPPSSFNNDPDLSQSPTGKQIQPLLNQDYGKMLDQYMADMKVADQQNTEYKKMQTLDKIVSHTPLDFFFPWHMKMTAEDDREFGLDYTPFKTFNRRRNYLVWLFSDKFDNLFTEEER